VTQPGRSLPPGLLADGNSLAKWLWDGHEHPQKAESPESCGAPSVDADRG